MKKKWTLIAKLQTEFRSDHRPDATHRRPRLSLQHESKQGPSNGRRCGRSRAASSPAASAPRPADMTRIGARYSFSAVLTQTGKMEALKRQFSEAATLASSDLVELNRLSSSEGARRDPRTRKGASVRHGRPHGKC